MDGRRVFVEAVRQMPAVLLQACAEAALTPDQLDLIVPHQANARIIEAIRHRLPGASDRVVNAIRRSGNTSSTSIPLCLAEVIGALARGSRIGLTAFGGGFTAASAVLEVVADD
jgi:3-oxoacyl-[acyl-carrier-protein] synthase-3